MDTETSEYSLSWDGHIQHVREAFNRLLHSSELCDVTLYADGQKIGAHKIFLSACSKYFDQLFKDFKNEQPVVVLKGIQFNILKHILNFVYNGETRVEVHQLKEFLEAAAFLKIDGLVENHIKRKRKNSSINESDTTSVGYEPNNSPAEIVDKARQQSPSNLCRESPLLPKISLRPPKLYKITSTNKNQEVSVNYPDFSKAPEIGKYPIDTPTPAGEWLSDYEFHSQSSIADSQSPLDENAENPPADEYTNYQESIDKSKDHKVRIIKSEPSSGAIESYVDEISSFNQIDFANSLDAEIEIHDDGEDEELEKELLKTPLASIDDKGLYLCMICGNSYKKKDSLKKHFGVHVNNTTCTICDKVLSRKTHLIRHYLGVHKKSSK